MRIGPLLRALGMDRRIVLDAVHELGERYWITIVWRTAATGPSDADGQPPTDIHRLCTTRFGRRKYRSSWPID